MSELDNKPFPSKSSLEQALTGAKDRANHTGTQPLSTISDAGTAAANDTTDFAQISGGADANFTTMPQVGDDPIVESGSNSDGEWVRYADGTQICTIKSAVGIAVNNAYGSIYISGVFQKTHPNTFVNPPSVSCGFADYSTAAPFLISNAVDSVVTTLRIVDPTSRTTVDYDYSVVLVGKWK